MAKEQNLLSEKFTYLRKQKKKQNKKTPKKTNLFFLQNAIYQGCPIHNTLFFFSVLCINNIDTLIVQVGDFFPNFS